LPPATIGLGTAVIGDRSNCASRAETAGGTPAALAASMRNSLFVALALLGLCAPAFAKAKCGDNYVVGKDQKRSSLTQAQVDEVMKTKVGEVEACWQNLPDDQRAKDTTAVLALEIDDTGEVQTVTIAGQPSELQHCVAIAAASWEFPRTDVKADALTFQYSVPLAPVRTASK
jgi:hypothetical protein